MPFNKELNRMTLIVKNGKAKSYKVTWGSEFRIYSARQLQNGARPFLPTTSKKPTVTSMEEVRRGLVKYNDPLREIPEELVPQE